MTISKIDLNSPELTEKERQDIVRWFEEDVLKECPNADVNDIVIFFEPKEVYTSIRCEYENGNNVTHAFALAGKVR